MDIVKSISRHGYSANYLKRKQDEARLEALEEAMRECWPGREPDEILEAIKARKIVKP